MHAAGFRTHAEQIGLDVDSMFFGIDEGRILGGPDGGNVNSHAIGKKSQDHCSCLFAVGSEGAPWVCELNAAAVELVLGTPSLLRGVFAQA